tara:strand:+ start:346 stop:534 length:189 start_codon:yes stop_codon:yes gene_type:complete
MNREEKKAHIDNMKNIMNLLDYFNQHLGIDTFDAKLEIAKIQSQITNIYHKHNEQLKTQKNP